MLFDPGRHELLASTTIADRLAASVRGQYRSSGARAQAGRAGHDARHA